MVLFFMGMGKKLKALGKGFSSVQIKFVKAMSRNILYQIVKKRFKELFFSVDGPLKSYFEL